MSSPRPESGRPAIVQRPHLSDPDGPPDGDYARYVERLLQRADLQRAAAQGAGAHAGADASPTPPAVPARVAAAAASHATTAGRLPRPAAPKRAVPQGLWAKWPLLLWCLFVLLMWFTPALLPLAIGAVLAAGVGHHLWRSRRARDIDRR